MTFIRTPPPNNAEVPGKTNSSSRSLAVGRFRVDRFWVVLAVIAVVGFAWRVAYVLWMRHQPVLGDGTYYHFSALDIVDGHPFVNFLSRRISGLEVPDASRGPGWTIVLAGPSALGLRSWLSHQFVAVAIGTATIVMTGLAGRAAFGRRTGIIAAAIVAVYPNIWLYERELQTETLAILLTATTIWLAYRYRVVPGPWRAVALGAAVGVLAMTRAEQITVVVFLLVPLILATAGVDWRRRIGWLAASVAACAIVILPWFAYNVGRFEKPVFIATSSGSTMLQANCDATYHGELLGYFKLGCSFNRTDFSRDPSVSDGQARRAAIDYMREHKSRVPVVVAARIGRTFGVFRPFQQMRFDADRHTELWVIRSGFFASWLLLPLAIVGALVARRRKVPIYPILAFPAAVLVSVTLTIGQTRYRAPVEVPIVVLASVALNAAFEWWRSHRVARETSAMAGADGPRL